MEQILSVNKEKTQSDLSKQIYSVNHNNYGHLQQYQKTWYSRIQQPEIQISFAQKIENKQNLSNSRPSSASTQKQSAYIKWKQESCSLKGSTHDKNEYNEKIELSKTVQLVEVLNAQKKILEDQNHIDHLQRLLFEKSVNKPIDQIKSQQKQNLKIKTQFQLQKQNQKKIAISIESKENIECQQKGTFSINKLLEIKKIKKQLKVINQINSDLNTLADYFYYINKLKKGFKLLKVKRQQQKKRSKLALQFYKNKVKVKVFHILSTNWALIKRRKRFQLEQKLIRNI